MINYRRVAFTAAFVLSTAGQSNAQFFQHEGGCTTPGSGLTAVLTGDLFGQGSPKQYKIDASAAPTRTLKVGEKYKIAYRLFASCTGNQSDLCLTVQGFEFDVRMVPGSVSAAAVANGTLLRRVRVNSHECSKIRNLGVTFTAPNMHPPGAYPGDAVATIGLCPPNRRLPCKIHTIRVAETDLNAGWNISGITLNSPVPTAGNGFSVVASIQNGTGRNSWPTNASMWVYPPLTATPRRVATVQVPSLQNGQRFDIRILIPGLPTGRHMIQACSNTTPETNFARLNCGPRTAIRVQ